MCNQNKLDRASLEWSLKHLLYEGDTDLFPKPFEIDVIKNQCNSLISELEKIDITNHVWSGYRKMLIPKEEFAFRKVCQLDPIDSLLFSAIIKNIGLLIENHRIPITSNKVFSYRFNPTPEGRFYGDKNLWEEFWTTSINETENYNWIAVTDISDFYNQIYLHTIENQLFACGVDNIYIKAIKNLLINVNGSSRGIPIGPYASHILAELSLIPIDDFLVLKGYNFCRYVDDLHIFCNTRDEAVNAIYELANILDANGNLILNRAKTDIWTKEKFLEKANSMLIDNPINSQEEIIMEIIRSRVDDPYANINLSDLSAEDLQHFSRDNIENILAAYINDNNPDYIRLRWFLRRLAQVGVPGGVEFIIENISRFIPAIGDAANYIRSAQNNYTGNWQDIGLQLIEALELPLVKTNEYLQVIILGLFSKMENLNNVNQLIQNYNKYNQVAQRKVVLSAMAGNASAWLRLFKDSYSTLDPWLKRAVIYSAKSFPKDEREFWLKQVKRTSDLLEKKIIESIINT